jgi:hypothetical protein
LIILNLNKTIMDNQNRSTSDPKWNEQNKIVNEQDQNRPVNTGDEDYKENTAGRSPEPSPRDLNISGSNNRTASKDAEDDAEIETPHKKEGDDETSTERKIPKM